jgi:hypothetical protein
MRSLGGPVSDRYGLPGIPYHFTPCGRPTSDHLGVGQPLTGHQAKQGLQSVGLAVARDTLLLRACLHRLPGYTSSCFSVSSCFIGVWQGVALDFLKYHLGLPCPTLLRPAGRQPLKRPYNRFKGGPTTGWAACGRLPPQWTPRAVRLCPV